MQQSIGSSNLTVYVCPGAFIDGAFIDGAFIDGAFIDGAKVAPKV